MIHKRMAVAVLALATAVALFGSACAEDEPPVTPGQSPTATGASPSFETLEEGVLRVGSCLDYPPFESVEGGDEVGFDVDLTEAIAERLGLEVEWVRADFDTIFTAVDQGQFDMVAAAVTATGETGEERDQTVDFSDYYFNSRQSLTINTSETPDIASTDDLGEGDVVGVQKGTTGKGWAEDNLEPQGVQVRTYQNAPDAFRDLEAGAITAVVNDEESTVGIIAELPSLELVEAIDTNEKYAFAFAGGNSGLIAAVNAALAEIIADGTYASIYEQYFEAEVPPEYSGSG